MRTWSHLAVVLTLCTANAATAAELIVNGGFEATTTARSAGSSGGYAYPHGTYDGWTYASTTGLLTGIGTSVWYDSAPTLGFAGAQYAFVQTTNTGLRGTLSQAFVADATGRLRIGWLEGGRRWAPGNGGDQTYSVLLNGVVLGTFTSVSGQLFGPRSVVANVGERPLHARLRRRRRSARQHRLPRFDQRAAGLARAGDMGADARRLRPRRRLASPPRHDGSCRLTPPSGSAGPGFARA